MIKPMSKRQFNKRINKRIKILYRRYRELFEEHENVILFMQHNEEKGTVELAVIPERY